MFLSKHKAQHDRVFKCSHSDCNRSHKGFSTSNDLDRHLKSVHNERNRKSVDYKCFARGCMKPEKIWPRLDNFRQHLKSMHGNEPADTLLKLYVNLITWERTRSNNVPGQGNGSKGISEHHACSPRRICLLDNPV